MVVVVSVEFVSSYRPSNRYHEFWMNVSEQERFGSPAPGAFTFTLEKWMPWLWLDVLTSLSGVTPEALFAPKKLPFTCMLQQLFRNSTPVVSFWSTNPSPSMEVKS